MTTTLTPEHLTRVTYARYFLLRADSLLSSGGELAGAEALLALHNGIEILMVVVLECLGLKRLNGFKDFWTETAKSPIGRAPYEAAMDRLNTSRVSFKHKGILPHRAVVKDLGTAAREFCIEVCSKYLNLSFKDVSLSDLVSHARTRQKIKDAESAFQQGKVKEALEHLRGAFDAIHGHAEEKWRSILFRIREKLALVYLNPVQRKWETDRGQTHAMLDLVAEATNALLLGVDPPRFLYFSAITPRLDPWSPTEEPRYSWRFDSEKATDEMFWFCLSFVLDFSLLVEREIRDLPEGLSTYGFLPTWRF